MAWLYIKPTRETTPDGPTGDPVDSDPTRYIRPCWTDGLIPTGFCFPHLKLWPFSPVLPVQVKHSRNHAYPRCGLWATYHCMPLASVLSRQSTKLLSCFDQTVVILLKKELNSNYNLKQSIFKCFLSKILLLVIASSLGFWPLLDSFLTITEILNGSALK